MKVLIVVDMQYDFIYGPLGTSQARDIVPRVKAKIEEYVKNKNPIIFTMDTHFEDYLDTKEGEKLPIPHCIFKEDGWKLVDELAFANGSQCQYEYGVGFHYVNKFTFGTPALFDIIQHYIDGWVVDEIELVGVCTDVCVISNALLLKSKYYQVQDISVDGSCCAGTTPEMHEAALDVMESCQIDVKRDRDIRSNNERPKDIH